MDAGTHMHIYTKPDMHTNIIAHIHHMHAQAHMHIWAHAAGTCQFMHTQVDILML